MESVLAEVHIEDPTAEAASDVEMADGVTAQATEQKVRHEKKDKKGKKDKKEKKDKKRKHASAEVNGEKKKKKKSKHD
jgi:nucleolar protein 56